MSLNLSDRVVDLAGEGFDCAVRVGDLPDSSPGQRAPGRQPPPVRGHARLPAAPPARRSTPADLARHDCLTLSSPTPRRRAAGPFAWSDGGRGGAPASPAGRWTAQRRPGAARLVPGGLRHRLAQHLGGGGAKSPPAGWCRCWRNLPRRPTASTWCSRSASTCRCGCGCGSTSSSTSKDAARVRQRLVRGMQPAHQHLDEGASNRCRVAGLSWLQLCGVNETGGGRLGDDHVGAVRAQVGAGRQVGHLAHRGARAQLRHALAVAEDLDRPWAMMWKVLPSSPLRYIAWPKGGAASARGAPPPTARRRRKPA
jgi:hypothetical protein